MKIGMIFPGQGSQYLGMGKDFFDSERAVQELFDFASNCLDQNFVRLCFASSEKELQNTVNAQTSIFLVSASIYKTLKDKYNIVPSIVAGHSLGEYSAIFAANGISFADALYLIKKRSLFMDKATEEKPGTMISVIGIPEMVLDGICKRYHEPENGKVAQIVNFNSPNQLVVSGTAFELGQVELDVKAISGKVIPLNVAGAFHSKLMEDAAKEFASYMLKVDFKDLDVSLINNCDAKEIKLANDVRDSLIKQLNSPVLWWQSMQHFKDLDLIIQVGPSDKLARILMREWPDKKIIAINKPVDIQNLFNLLDRKMPVDLSNNHN
ncbi:ACP S-malonyltransferase [Candidatus Dependentiae bacterium]|nr:ACP S-malonyltransferase [Candidatus Dependentiae bacterium]MBU4387120.1 ACP S-malonyltransferase [Candidatus Dependentiae bacterium]MCG2756081.1 ACP S-malonyltransferase [Candidatus Dependentiae bacterium]